MPDDWEALYDGLDPLVDDAGDDLDGDGFTNLVEFKSGSDPDNSDSIPSTDLGNGLVAYYPFNGNANDESGNGNHGTVN